MVGKRAARELAGASAAAAGAAERGLDGGIRWWSWPSESFGRLPRGSFSARSPYRTFPMSAISVDLANSIAQMIFLWLLVALAVFDAENLWLPDRLIWPGIGLGLVLGVTRATLSTFMANGGDFGVVEAYCCPRRRRLVCRRRVRRRSRSGDPLAVSDDPRSGGHWLRRCEVDGDAGRMVLCHQTVVARLGDWHRFRRGLVALLLLALPSVRASRKNWKSKKLPFGAFICLGGIISASLGPTHHRCLYALGWVLTLFPSRCIDVSRAFWRISLEKQPESKARGCLLRSRAAVCAEGTPSRWRSPAPSRLCGPLWRGGCPGRTPSPSGSSRGHWQSRPGDVGSQPVPNTHRDCPDRERVRIQTGKERPSNSCCRDSSCRRSHLQPRSHGARAHSAPLFCSAFPAACRRPGLAAGCPFRPGWNWSSAPAPLRPGPHLQGCERDRGPRRAIGMRLPASHSTPGGRSGAFSVGITGTELVSSGNGLALDCFWTREGCWASAGGFWLEASSGRGHCLPAEPARQGAAPLPEGKPEPALLPTPASSPTPSPRQRQIGREPERGSRRASAPNQSIAHLRGNFHPRLEVHCRASTCLIRLRRRFDGHRRRALATHPGQCSASWAMSGNPSRSAALFHHLPLAAPER